MPLLSRLRNSFDASVAGLPRAFWFLWAGTFITRAGSFVLPFLALYLTQVLGLSLSHAGMVVSLYGAGGAIAGPVGGFLADRVGRRFTIVLALGVGGAGMIALGMMHRVEWIAPTIFLVALVTEMYRPATQAAISDMVAPSDRVRAFGVLYWVINVGFAIGLTVGGLLASKSYFWLFVGDGATTMVYALLVAFGVPETRPATAARVPGTPRPHLLAGFLTPYRDRHFVMFLGLCFLFAMIFMQNATSFALDMTAHGMSGAVFGRVLALNGVIIVLVQPFLGPVLAKHDRARTLAAGSALVGIGFGLNAIAHTVPIYALGVIIWTVGEMGVLPVANAVVADLAPPEIRGRYQGAYGFAFGLAVCAAPVVGMFVLEHAGSATLWLGCLVTGLGIAAGHLMLSRSRSAQHGPGSDPSRTRQGAH
ncbi:MAG: MFS transporter [Candidatus Eisenbacteria bacterium]